MSYFTHLTSRTASVFAVVLCAWGVMAPDALALPQVGNTSTQGDRYGDILRAQRCMDYTMTWSKDHFANDFKNNSTIPQHIKNAFTVGVGQRKTMRDTKYVGLPANPKNRPSGWSYADLFGTKSTRFRAEFYKRYATPRNAAPGTYNLTFSVMSDNDQVYVCIRGTEPEIFPKGKPRGNTMNNLKAAPRVNKSFDKRALVHDGWSTMAIHYRNVLTPILKSHGISKKKLIITGHSQGGVVAGYIAFLLAKDRTLPTAKKHRLITFGAPRYGTANFLQRFGTVLKRKAPNMTVDTVETDGDIVPGAWPLGSLPIGSVWRALPKEVGYNYVKMLDMLGHHNLAISGYHAVKIINTKGKYKGPTTVSDAVTTTVSGTFSKTCPKGYKKTALNCVETKCSSGFVFKGDKCVSQCPSNTKRSGTGAHCMTSTRKFSQTTKKVWVGHLKKPKKYRKACPSGTTFSHDLAGYSYCNAGICPTGFPVRKGNMCHASCGPLKTDAFGNCIVQSKSPKTVPHQCPPGTRRKGPVCVK